MNDIPIFTTVTVFFFISLLYVSITILFFLNNPEGLKTPLKWLKQVFENFKSLYNDKN